MARATIPVSIAGIEFDALISSDHKMEASVPEYATENGFKVSDTIILGQETLSMVLYLTDTPVTWYNRHGANKGRVKNICAKLQSLYYTATPVKIVTTDRTYNNMAIESITISKSLENGYAREIPISFRKIRVTAAKFTTIPSSYGKSGTSNSSSGTASTSASSSTASTSSSAASNDTLSSLSIPSGGGSSSGGGDSSSKSSILYSAGSSLGIIN